MNAPETFSPMLDFKNHDLVDDTSKPGVRYQKRPARKPDGSVVPGLYNAWITLDNQAQYNSYTTDMVKGVILALRAASNARDVNCIVFTGAGDKAFCTGGNTKEYAEYYPAALDLVLDGKVQIAPFVEKRPLETINEVFAAVHRHEIRKRVVLVP